MKARPIKKELLTFNRCMELYKKARYCKTIRTKAVRLANNTYLYQHLTYFSVLLHQTDIIDIFPDKWVLRNGGWCTPTTKERINAFSPITVWQYEYEWLYSFHGEQEVFNFENGLTISKYDILEQLI